MQQALAQLPVAVIDLGPTINLTKVEAIEFRKKGRPGATDTLHLARSPLAYVNGFPYLELLFFANGRSSIARVTENAGKQF